MCSELTDVPSLDEIRTALLSLVVGNKAVGINGILPKMVKACSDELLVYLLDLFSSIWVRESVPQEWRNASLVAVPKKGDLSSCDNWHGISLLDVVGSNVFAKIVQQRLQAIVKEEVADSQCGFQCNCGCIDMILCVNQLIEKAVDHKSISPIYRSQKSI